MHWYRDWSARCGDACRVARCYAATQVAVDFQYVGGGCGMKDVVYLLGSCLSEEQCEQWQNELLSYYFAQLKQALADSGLDRDELEQEWRSMFAIAWTDFYRFLAGWMPSHRKINQYTQRLAVEAIAGLKNK